MLLGLQLSRRFLGSGPVEVSTSVTKGRKVLSLRPQGYPAAQIRTAAMFGEGVPNPGSIPNNTCNTPSSSNKPVFHHPSLSIDNLEILDARDAMETCQGLHGEAKDACYMLFGCDPQGVETYLTVVERLENSLQLEPDPCENCWRTLK